MSAQDIRQTRISLVLRIEDIDTGRTLSCNDADVDSYGSALAWPVCKSDGYFVFVGSRPEWIRISAKGYEHAAFSPGPENTGVLRVALVPTTASGLRARELRLPPGEELQAGFGGTRAGYALAGDIAVGADSITLQKSYVGDITSMWHILLNRKGIPSEAAYISEGMGYGRYRLLAPAQKAHAAREYRLIPMRRIIGPPEGVLRIPSPQGASDFYTMDCAGGEVKRVSLEDL